jgi:hypothetical protein
MMQSIEAYMHSRRREIDRYVEGEHAWYGDTSTVLPSLSCYNPMPVPWYCQHSVVLEPLVHREPLPVI